MKIIGQKSVKKDIKKVFNIFIKSICKIKPHFILTGNSGCGKTLLIKSISKELNIDFVEINSAQITKEGISGNSLSKCLTVLRNKQSIPTICFVDEFDKLFISGNSNSQFAHESTNGVQNEFLKILEGENATVFGDYGKYETISVKNVLFVFAGAFNNEKDITIDKLRDFGVKTEFLGRVGLIYNITNLTIDDLHKIIDNSELLETYIELFKDVDKQKCKSDIKEHLDKIYENNTLGARIINNLIHEYFIEGGFKEQNVEKITFQKKLSFETKS